MLDSSCLFFKNNFNLFCISDPVSIHFRLYVRKLQVRAGKPSDYQELALEAASLEEKLAWLAAINAHTHYIESSLKIAAQVEQQAAAAAVAKNTASAAVTAPVSTASVAPATTTAATSTTDSAATVAGAVASGSTKELPVPPTPNVSVNTPSAAALSLAAATATPAAATATTPATSAPAPALPAAPSVTATNDPKPWMVYVDASLQETIVLCGLVNKPNPMGKQLLRELILTSRKRLIYVDSQSLEIKGEIDWVTENGVDHFVKIVSHYYSITSLHSLFLFIRLFTASRKIYSIIL